VDFFVCEKITTGENFCCSLSVVSDCRDGKFKLISLFFTLFKGFFADSL
jgi:hypothetical protein